MLKLRYFFSLFFLLNISLNLASQIHENSIPFSVNEKLGAITTYVEMASVDNEMMINENKKQQADGIKNYKFAKLFNVDLSPENSGEWQETGEGKIWRLGIRSKNAYSVYLTFDSFWLNRGVKLFIYSPDYSDFKGAFTQKNNTGSHILSVSPIAGEALIVELDIPKEIDDYGKLHVSKVYHDFINEFGKKNTPSLKNAYDNNCVEDINCNNGKYWQTEKKAICKIVVNGEMCTGTLIGNTSGDKEPYLLTANHCIYNGFQASESIFFFNYEYPSCNSTIINDEQSLSGATLIATTDQKLDFTLIKLNDIPPVSYMPFYAGWDARDTPPQSGVCIHHPWGMEKQIAIEYHPLITGSFGQWFDTLSTWRVSHWEVGTTQPGSSGAPLFNSQHRLVGTLTGGIATCENPVNDYFTKFKLDFDRYPDSINQLKYWLDPLQKESSYMDGYDPYGFNSSICDTGWNIQNNEELDLSNSGLLWGWISGHNSSMYTEYAEKFYSPSSLQISGFLINVAKAYNAQPLSNIVIKVWEGDVTPLKEIYSKMIFIRNFQPNAINYVGFDSTLKVTGNFYIGYSINYSSQLDSFAVYHAMNRGVSSPSTFYFYNGTWQNSNTLGLSTSLDIGVVECYGKVHRPEVNSLNVYPNPCKNFIYVDVPNTMTIYGIECSDLTGKIIPISYQLSEDSNKVDFNLSSGIYILKILTKGHQYFSRIIVLKN